MSLDTEKPSVMEWFQNHINKKLSDSPSPLTRWLDPVLISAEKGKLVFKHTIREEMLNPGRVLHGGIIAAIIDDAIGATTFSLEDGFFTTINLQVDYFAPVKLEDSILAETTVIKKGRQIIHLQCEVWNETKTRCVARGNSNLIKVNLSNK